MNGQLQHNEVIDDYYLDEEEKEFQEDLNFLNIYLWYFKHLFNQKKSMHMFEGINYEKDDSTNRCLELLYEEVEKYKEAKDDITKITLYNPDEININNCQELYVLIINNEHKKVCQTLIPLIRYLATDETNKWTEMNWMIVPLKKNYE